MLGVFFDSALDGVHESLGFAQALTKESHESLSAKKNISLVLYRTLLLLLAEQGNIFQESSRKRNLVWLVAPVVAKWSLHCWKKL